MGAVSSAIVLATFSSEYILSFQFTNENPKTFENYGRLRTLFRSFWVFKLLKNLNDKQV